MATDFVKTYCKYSQILVTSHSPAFIGLDAEKLDALYRCFRTTAGTKIVPLSQAQERDDLAEELGYVQIQKEVYELLKQRTTTLEEVVAQKNRLVEELYQLKKTVLYTEGKTDVKILETAWKKLYDSKECPFEIKSCNTLAEKDGSAAGCDVLKNLLCTARPDSPQLIIGLFDQDGAGINAFSLSNNFVNMENGWKQHKNKRAHALLLPIPPGKEQFALYKNLCIEFYFEKSDLDSKIDGKGLKLKEGVAPAKFNGIPIESPSLTALHFQQIDENTKNYFTEVIVPTLQESSFVNFTGLFEKILQILEEDRSG